MSERAGGSRRLPASAWVFDSALALLAAAVPTALYVFEPPNPGLPRSRFVLGWALVLLHTLPLVARRRFPGTVLVLVVASGLAFAILDLPPDILGLALLVAVYSVAAYGRRWVPLAGLAGVEAALVAVQYSPGRTGVGTLVGNLGVVAAAAGPLRPQLPCLCRPAGGADGRAGAGPGGAGPPGGHRRAPAPGPGAA
jgi:hypothetical protein